MTGKSDISAKDKIPSPHRGWHSRGYLPHFDANTCVQHLSLHVADSLPQDAVERIQRDIERAPASKRTELRKHQLHRLLDAGMGTCLLRDNHCAQIVEDALLFGDPDRYRLIRWCIMPNHVHVLIQQNEHWPLAQIVQNWKRHTQREIANLPAYAGVKVWCRDYWDRYIRDAAHFDTVIRYIDNNPVSAGLVSQIQDWPWGNARIPNRSVD